MRLPALCGRKWLMRYSAKWFEQPEPALNDRSIIRDCSNSGESLFGCSIFQFGIAAYFYSVSAMSFLCRHGHDAGMSIAFHITRTFRRSIMNNITRIHPSGERAPVDTGQYGWRRILSIAAATRSFGGHGFCSHRLRWRRQYDSSRQWMFQRNRQCDRQVGDRCE